MCVFEYTTSSGGEGGGGGGFDGSTCLPLARAIAPTFWPFDNGLSGSASVTFFRAGTFLGPPTGTASAVSLRWGLDLDTQGIA